MLDHKDLQLIEQSVEKVVDRSLEKFAIKVLNPSFQAIQDQITEVKENVQTLTVRVDDLDATLRNQYPTKTYLDLKLSEWSSTIVKKFLEREERERGFKLSLISLLEKHAILPQAELVQLKEFV